MKLTPFILGAVIAASLHAGERARPRIDALESVQHVMRLRQLVDDFYANPNADAAATIRTVWQNLPADMRSRIEAHHPGTATRIVSLESEIEAKPDSLHRDTTITGPNGNTATSEATWTKTGDTVTREGSTTGPKGNTVQSEDIWKKSGNEVTHEGTTTGPRGGETKREDQWTRTGNTLNHTGSREATRPPQHFADELDIFGNRPHPTRKR